MTTVPESAKRSELRVVSAPGHEAAELPAVVGLAGYLVTTVLLVAPLLLAQRSVVDPGAVLLGPAAEPISAT